MNEILNETPSSMKVAGYFNYTHIRDGKVIDEWQEPNLVVNEGLNYTLDAALSNGTVYTAWYIGLFKNNYTPIATNVMSTFPGAGVANEANTEYDEASRQTWTDAGASSQSITNSASPAAFTFNTTVTIYGAFLSSSNTKAGTSGVLFSASKFTSSRAMLDNDILQVTYTVAASST